MTARAGRGFVIALAGVVIVAGAPALFRPGYSPDEEFTVFAVRGIRAHGLPLLPSGLLYDRGLLYSYVSWLARAATGLELPAFRGVSLLCSASVLSLFYALVRRVASPAAGVVAAMLVGMSLPFWAVATTGRFYAPFLLTCLGILVFLARGPRAELRWASPGGTWLPLAGLALLSRLTHELAFTLLAIPVAALTASSVAHR
ncbi:MAG TPA: glycosyltransferase family 39 protein, partial [Vicinamibacterales bacterium]|nr:glycosyltransferase family 39 protein [Vicinamibacterales bacterium]